MEIKIKPAYQELEVVRELLTEYTSMILDYAPEFAHYLKLQDYEAELNQPSLKYGQPYGRLYLVQVEGVAAGCIAMQRLDALHCEMKRLYIRPQFRGKGLARRLVKRLLAEAKKEGYQAMLLDTFPFLQKAIRLYRDLGFYEIASYNNSPLDATIYMKKDLCPACGERDGRKRSNEIRNYSLHADRGVLPRHQ